MTERTTKEWLNRIDQKLDDFVDNCKEERADHRREHSLMWKLIIGLPSGVLILFALIKVFGS